MVDQLHYQTLGCSGFLQGRDHRHTGRVEADPVKSPGVSFTQSIEKLEPLQAEVLRHHKTELTSVGENGLQIRDKGLIQSLAINSGALGKQSHAASREIDCGDRKASFTQPAALDRGDGEGDAKGVVKLAFVFVCGPRIEPVKLLVDDSGMPFSQGILLLWGVALNPELGADIARCVIAQHSLVHKAGKKFQLLDDSVFGDGVTVWAVRVTDRLSPRQVLKAMVASQGARCVDVVCREKKFERAPDSEVAGESSSSGSVGSREEWAHPYRPSLRIVRFWCGKLGGAEFGADFSSLAIVRRGSDAAFGGLPHCFTVRRIDKLHPPKRGGGLFEQRSHGAGMPRYAFVCLTVGGKCGFIGVKDRKKPRKTSTVGPRVRIPLSPPLHTQPLTSRYASGMPFGCGFSSVYNQQNKLPRCMHASRRGRGSLVPALCSPWVSVAASRPEQDRTVAWVVSSVLPSRSTSTPKLNEPKR